MSLFPHKTLSEILVLIKNVISAINKDIGLISVYTAVNLLP